MTAPAVELDIAEVGDERARRPRAPQAGSEAWERFLQERALESGRQPLRRWRDEEGL